MPLFNYSECPRCEEAYRRGGGLAYLRGRVDILCICRVEQSELVAELEVPRFVLALIYEFVMDDEVSGGPLELLRYSRIVALGRHAPVVARRLSTAKSSRSGAHSSPKRATLMSGSNVSLAVSRLTPRMRWCRIDKSVRGDYCDGTTRLLRVIDLEGNTKKRRLGAF